MTDTRVSGGTEATGDWSDHSACRRGLGGVTCRRSTYLRVYYQGPTLIFDPDRVYDQNQHGLFKRLKNFTIIKASFDWGEGVAHLSARA